MSFAGFHFMPICPGQKGFYYTPGGGGGGGGLLHIMDYRGMLCLYLFKLEAGI